ncbi:glycosyltransferase family 2 protein [Cohnella sp. REN36]|uniref:glycosyltransferase family 2 protein n=1 Tax=Cohnella sp. REN36 TaxID=2887347 RepID=UPI001D148450|nr:glycosyltransferase family 2 protein [Cohnella sp. REN36]MCC3376824.1 glycosyltransferase [Cohnella sp. REN36]
MWIGWIFALLAAGVLAGFALFRRRTIVSCEAPGPAEQGQPRKLSVIIPARNEAFNLPGLLASLREQTLRPFEVIVVDDDSSDGTADIARRYGATVVTHETPLPPGWTGKNWALRTGYAHAAGDLIAFLDADIRLAPAALASLVQARERAGGVVSVVPYHTAGRFYERLALILNVLGVFAFTSFLERRHPTGLYGSCILTTREDYERAGGHDGVRSEVLEDLSLGVQYGRSGISVTNFLGAGMVSFRMYPHGIRSAVQGFSKGALLSTSKLSGYTILLVALWVVGLIAAELGLIFAVLAPSGGAVLLATGYLLYTLQLAYFIRYVGKFGVAVPLVHLLSTLSFLYVMAYSAYRVVFRGHVTWKGRQIEVGGKSSR